MNSTTCRVTYGPHGQARYRLRQAQIAACSRKHTQEATS